MVSVLVAVVVVVVTVAILVLVVTVVVPALLRLVTSSSSGRCKGRPVGTETVALDQQVVHRNLRPPGCLSRTYSL